MKKSPTKVYQKIDFHGGARRLMNQRVSSAVSSVVVGGKKLWLGRQVGGTIFVLPSGRKREKRDKGNKEERREKREGGREERRGGKKESMEELVVFEQASRVEFQSCH